MQTINIGNRNPFEALREIAKIIDADPNKDLVEEVREGVRLAEEDAYLLSQFSGEDE